MEWYLTRMPFTTGEMDRIEETSLASIRGVEAPGGLTNEGTVLPQETTSGEKKDIANTDETTIMTEEEDDNDKYQRAVELSHAVRSSKSMRNVAIMLISAHISCRICEGVWGTLSPAERVCAFSVAVWYLMMGDLKDALYP